ncbi:MAG: hypothetical protein WC749_16515 [Dehalococcoidia bacterium]
MIKTRCPGLSMIAWNWAEGGEDKPEQREFEKAWAAGYGSPPTGGVGYISAALAGAAIKSH